MDNNTDKKIVFCGCTETGIDVLNYLLNNNFKINYIVSLTESQATKYKVSGYSCFDELSKQHGIPIYYPKEYSLKNEEDIAFFNKNSFDILILGGWQRLIPENILKTLKIGGIGTHGSSEFLPEGKGRSPVNWSIIEGKRRYILQLFLMTPGIDDGDIVDYKMCDINEWDTCKTLYYKIAILQKTMLKDQIPKLLSNNFTRIPQKGESTFYPKRNPEDGLIDWNKTVFEIYDFVRALTKPYPGAFGYIGDNPIYLWKAQPFDTRLHYPHAQKGEIVEKFINGDFVVNCRSGLLLVTEYSGEIEIGQIFTTKF
jgi:methionyl-tRNA formyltransferase